MSYIYRVHIVILLSLSFLIDHVIADDIAERLFSQWQNSVYQIEVVTSDVKSKSSLGTGFVVARADILATNFHVVAKAVHEPERFQLEWKNQQDERGSLEVIAIDVINDLALLKADRPMGVAMQTTALPPVGASLFSMGHPKALDLSIVTGSMNGQLEKSLYQRIHFSGNINRGMSGGPAFDQLGNVVGINVATSGDAVGFLVPAHFLERLIETSRQSDFTAYRDFSIVIGEQLMANQERIVSEFLNEEWTFQQIGKMSVPTKISERLNCWGNSQLEKEDIRLTELSAICRSDDRIFVSNQFFAGLLSFEYFWFESKSLTSTGFYKAYQDNYSSNFLGEAQEEDVTNFNCVVKFLNIDGADFKANICARAYKRYPELVDFMVLLGMVGKEKEGFIYTLDLSTVTLSNGMLLFEKFLENFSWQR